MIRSCAHCPWTLLITSLMINNSVENKLKYFYCRLLLCDWRRGRRHVPYTRTSLNLDIASRQQVHKRALKTELCWRWEYQRGDQRTPTNGPDATARLTLLNLTLLYFSSAPRDSEPARNSPHFFIDPDTPWMSPRSVKG